MHEKCNNVAFNHFVLRMPLIREVLTFAPLHPLRSLLKYLEQMKAIFWHSPEINETHIEFTQSDFELKTLISEVLYYLCFHCYHIEL